MRPLDPRLLQHAHETRGFLVASVAIGTMSAVLLVAQALLIAGVVAVVFQGGATVADLSGPISALVGITVARGLARVLLADRPIVNLDEPGEHLDPTIADEVTGTALTSTAGRCVVLITHRMAHTEDCDEVVVLSEGRIVARDTPADQRATDGSCALAVTREQPRPQEPKEPVHG